MFEKFFLKILQKLRRNGIVFPKAQPDKAKKIELFQQNIKWSIFRCFTIGERWKTFSCYEPRKVERSASCLLTKWCLPIIFREKFSAVETSGMLNYKNRRLLKRGAGPLHHWVNN